MCTPASLPSASPPRTKASEEACNSTMHLFHLFVRFLPANKAGLLDCFKTPRSDVLMSSLPQLGELFELLHTAVHRKAQQKRILLSPAWHLDAGPHGDEPPPADGHPECNGWLVYSPIQDGSPLHTCCVPHTCASPGCSPVQHCSVCTWVHSRSALHFISSIMRCEVAKPSTTFEINIEAAKENYPGGPVFIECLLRFVTFLL